MPRFSFPFPSSLNQQTCNSSFPNTSSFSTPLPAQTAKAPYSWHGTPSLKVLSWVSSNLLPANWCRWEWEGSEHRREAADSAISKGPVGTRALGESSFNCQAWRKRPLWRPVQDIFLILQRGIYEGYTGPADPLESYS